MSHKAMIVLDAHPIWEEVRPKIAKTLHMDLTLVHSVPKLRESLRQKFFLLCLVADSLPGLDVAQLLQEIKQEFPFLPVFLLASRPTVEGAKTAMRHGAQDYLAAPLDWDRLKELLAPFAGNGHLSWLPAKNHPADDQPSRPVITQDPAMLHILRLAEAVAPTRATVLIQGESGTGKEVLARYIHAKSDRAAGPFVAVNCAALPEGLLESELFGHEKGAFTGAIMRKLGKFELAHNGTLLLDEISEMHPHLQAKLLRVLQENEIDRVGGHRPIAVNVRVIATTNQNLTDLIQKGGFREDLYYRLQVISLHLPPLRARRQDIPLLAEFFLQRYAQLFKKGPLRFTSAALKALESAPWPGNVRQLENAVARGVLLAAGHYVHPQDLIQDLSPGEAPAPDTPGPTPGKPITLREMEQHLIFQALQETSGNRTHAAKLLGISVRTLRNKLHEYRHLGLLDAPQDSQVA